MPTPITTIIAEDFKTDVRDIKRKLNRMDNFKKVIVEANNIINEIEDDMPFPEDYNDKISKERQEHPEKFWHNLATPTT